MEINSPTVPWEKRVVPLLMVWMSRCSNTNRGDSKQNKVQCVCVQVPIIWEDQDESRSISISISVACFVFKARLCWGVCILGSMIFQTISHTLKRAKKKKKTHHTWLMSSSLGFFYCRKMSDPEMLGIQKALGSGWLTLCTQEGIQREIKNT